MRAFGILLAACLLLAILRQAIVALLIILAILLLWFALTRPRDLICMLIAGGGWAFLDQHPVAAVVSLAIIGLVAAIGHLARGSDR